MPTTCARSIRTALVKAKLAGDFEAAFDLALYQMGRAVFAPGYHDHALDIAVRETPDRPNTRMNDADFADWSPGEAMLADRSHLSFDWLAIEDDGESFAALRALPRAEKEALFAACVARTVKGQLAFQPQARPELEATVARLDIDFAAHVRPTADMLWSRIARGTRAGAPVAARLHFVRRCLAQYAPPGCPLNRRSGSAPPSSPTSISPSFMQQVLAVPTARGGLEFHTPRSGGRTVGFPWGLSRRACDFTFYRFMIALMAFPTFSAAASMSRSPRWA